MTIFPLSMASNLQTREIVWISSADNAKNSDGRPAPYVHWGVPAAIIAGQYAATTNRRADPEWAD